MKDAETPGLSPRPLLRRAATWIVAGAFAAGFVLGSAWPSARAEGEVGAKAAPPAPTTGREATTVFVDVGPFGRRDGAAKRLSERHREFAAQGFTFVDLEAYVENGDLEGFWVTYVREP